MDTKEAFEKLRQLNQRHLLAHWDKLNLNEQAELIKQINALNKDTLHRQQSSLQAKKTLTHFTAFKDYFLANSSSDSQDGKSLISQGLMGCLIAAGGQASRLRLSGPKGFFPTSLIKHKSLFQIFAEKTLAASRQAGRPLLLAIMTSPLNHSEIVAFFYEHHFFGLDPSQVSFFSQGMLPLLNEEGNLFLESPARIAEGPNGNGQALDYFYRSGIWQHWYQQGIRYLNFVLIDNPLADPFDAELLGFHVRNHNEITLKCTHRKDVFEKVGVLVTQENQCRVIEYLEFPKEEWNAVTSDNMLKHRIANLSLFCASMQFIERIALSAIEMPLHPVKKSVKSIDSQGHSIFSEQPNAWKFEKFIFDIFAYSNKTQALLFPREECYAPLKNISGEDSIETVHQALQTIDYQAYYRISGKVPPSHPFELAQDFHYPTPFLLSKWKGRDLPPISYVEP